MSQNTSGVNTYVGTPGNDNGHKSKTTEQSNNSPILTTNSTNVEIVNDSATTNAIAKTEFLRERQKTYDWLKANGYPAFPVSPLQDAEKYPKWDTKKKCYARNKNGDLEPKFTGKNPSYIDEYGIPQSITHSEYQNKLPTNEVQEKWFLNELVGIGTLGGFNNTVWIDFDVKNFPDQEACDRAVNELVAKNPQINNFVERTHSGGWRFGVRVVAPPSFTNFALTPGGKQCGEALGEGRFTVLAPTLGVSGNSYISISRDDLPVFDNLETIGIFPTKGIKEKKTTTANTKKREKVTAPVSVSSEFGSLNLLALASQKVTDIILGGSQEVSDRSDTIAIVAKELLGWLHWGFENGVSIIDDHESLCIQAAENVNLFDENRVNRILGTISFNSVYPACEKYGQKEVWKKVKNLKEEMYQGLCPDAIKAEIDRETDEIKQENMTKELNGALTDDDLMNIALENGNDEVEYRPTKAVLEAEKKAKIDAAKQTYNINTLPAKDNWSLFHPAFGDRAKKRAESKKITGASNGLVLAISSLITGVSPITLVTDGIEFERPALLYSINIGDTATDKTGTTYNPLTTALMFISQLDKFSLEQEFDKVEKAYLEGDQDIKKIIDPCLKSLGCKKVDELREISPLYLDNDSSTMQGLNRSISFLKIAHKIRKTNKEFFNQIYAHPLILTVDEIADTWLRIYRSDSSSHFPSKTELNKAKEVKVPISGTKRLAKACTHVATQQRSYFGNLTIQDAEIAFNLEKTSSDGFTGRHTFNFQVGNGDFTYDSKRKPDTINKIEKELKLLILGSIIVNTAFAHKICLENVKQTDNFHFDQSARERYEIYTNQEIKTYRKSLLIEYPEWSSLTSNVVDKNWQSIIDITPNLKRFNQGIEIFLKLLEKVYPGRKLIDFAPLLTLDDDSDELIVFAKRLLLDLPLGFYYSRNENEYLTLDEILNPQVIDSNNNIDTTNFIIDEFYVFARAWEYEIPERILTCDDLDKGISVALNSIFSFGLTLKAFEIKALGENVEKTANRIKASDTVVSSISKHSTQARVRLVINTLNKSIFDNGDITYAALCRQCKPLKKIVDKTLVEDILDTMTIEELGYLKNVGVNCRGAVHYKIIKRPSIDDIAKIANAVDA